MISEDEVVVSLPVLSRYGAYTFHAIQGYPYFTPCLLFVVICWYYVFGILHLSVYPPEIAPSYETSNRCIVVKYTCYLFNLFESYDKYDE